MKPQIQGEHKFLFLPELLFFCLFEQQRLSELESREQEIDLSAFLRLFRLAMVTKSCDLSH